MGPGWDRLLEATDPFGTRIGWVLSRHMAETDPFGTRIGWVLSRHTAETDPFGTRLGRVVKGNGSVWDQDRTGSQQAHTTETDPVSEP